MKNFSTHKIISLFIVILLSLFFICGCETKNVENAKENIDSIINNLSKLNGEITKIDYLYYIELINIDAKALATTYNGTSDNNKKALDSYCLTNGYSSVEDIIKDTISLKDKEMPQFLSEPTSNAIVLQQGNYVVPEDIEAGMYDIESKDLAFVEIIDSNGTQKEFISLSATSNQQTFKNVSVVDGDSIKILHSNVYFTKN